MRASEPPELLYVWRVVTRYTGALDHRAIPRELTAELTSSSFTG